MATYLIFLIKQNYERIFTSRYKLQNYIMHSYILVRDMLNNKNLINDDRQ